MEVFTQKNTLGNVGAWGMYDQDRINILDAYAQTIWSADPDAYVILEHFAENSEETETNQTKGEPIQIAPGSCGFYRIYGVSTRSRSSSGG